MNLRAATRRATLTVATGLVAGGVLMVQPVTIANAAPLDPCIRDATECSRNTPQWVGPGARDWYCTWDVRAERGVCTYHPGAGYTSGKVFVEYAKPWWQWW